MTRWVLAFSSMDDPASGGRFGEVGYEGSGEGGGGFLDFFCEGFGECESGEGVSVFGGYVVG